MSKFCVSIAVLLGLAFAGVAADKPAVSDDTIHDKVGLKLASDPDVKGGALKIDVKDGVVTLNGVLELQKHKDKATKVARKVKGVKQVVNNITLREQTAGR